MEVSTKTEKTYDLTGLTEYQARDLLYLVAKIPDDSGIPINGRQGELLSTIRQALLGAGLTLKDPTK